MRIAVLGGGIVGLTTARALVDQGHHVVLVDRADRPGAGASAQNGAQLSYAFVAPLASPALPLQVPQLLFTRDSPLRLRPGASPEVWRWCAEFLAACTQSRADRSTHALLALALASQQGFDRWRADVPADRIDHARRGKLVLYRSPAGMEAAGRQLALQAAAGPPQSLLTPAECLAREPALDPAAPLAGGVWTPTEEVADCAKVCDVLAQQLAAGPRFEAAWGHRVVDWVRGGGKATAVLADHGGRRQAIGFDACVVAAGAQTAPLLRPLGVRVPVQPLKGYSIDLPARHVARMPATSITDTAIKTVFAPLGNGAAARLRVAGFAELVGDDTRLDPGRIAALVDAVERVFGLVDRPAEVHPWAGLRPATPTGLPVIGRAGALPNVFVNSGQGALGFTLAFGSADLLADAVAGRTHPLSAALRA